MGHLGRRDAVESENIGNYFFNKEYNLSLHSNITYHTTTSIFNALGAPDRTILYAQLGGGIAKRNKILKVCKITGRRTTITSDFCFIIIII
jgi:hypothetical protein